MIVDCIHAVASWFSTYNPLACSLRDDFNASVQGIQHLLVKKSKPNDLTFLAELMSGGKNAKPKMVSVSDCLGAYVPKPGLLVNNFNAYNSWTAYWEYTTLLKS